MTFTLFGGVSPHAEVFQIRIFNILVAESNLVRKLFDAIPYCALKGAVRNKKLSGTMIDIGMQFLPLIFL